MPRITSITLGEHFDKFVSDKIEKGRFHSVSEAVRAGLRRLEEDEAKLEALRSKLQASKESQLVDDFDTQQFLVEIRRKSAWKMGSFRLRALARNDLEVTRGYTLDQWVSGRLNAISRFSLAVSTPAPNWIDNSFRLVCRQ